MWRCVRPGLIDVSEESIPSIFRVEKNPKVGKQPSADAGGFFYPEDGFRGYNTFYVQLVF
jgi:hypothetical protein